MPLLIQPQIYIRPAVYVRRIPPGFIYVKAYLKKNAKILLVMEKPAKKFGMELYFQTLTIS
jgi:hypothetical protein